jgi:hypothetical protein
MDSLTRASWPRSELGMRRDEANEAIHVKRFVTSISLAALNASLLQCFNFLPKLMLYRLPSCLSCLDDFFEKY